MWADLLLGSVEHRFTRMRTGSYGDLVIALEKLQKIIHKSIYFTKINQTTVSLVFFELKVNSYELKLQYSDIFIFEVTTARKNHWCALVLPHTEGPRTWLGNIGILPRI